MAGEPWRLPRSVQHQPALRVRYQLTWHGRTLSPVFETLWTWGVRHIEQARNRPPAAG